MNEKLDHVLPSVFFTLLATTVILGLVGMGTGTLWSSMQFDFLRGFFNTAVALNGAVLVGRSKNLSGTIVYAIITVIWAILALVLFASAAGLV